MRRQLSCLVGNTNLVCAQVKMRARSDRSGRARCNMFALHHCHVGDSRKRHKITHFVQIYLNDIPFNVAYHMYDIFFYDFTMKWFLSIPIGVSLPPFGTLYLPWGFSGPQRRLQPF